MSRRVSTPAGAVERWFPYRQPRPDARLRLFCFPYAGGSAAAFRGWQGELPEAVELWPVQPPGRERRMAEPPFTRLEDLVAALENLLVPLLDRPYALLGHSLGALVAFELMRHLVAIGAPPAVHLVVSGSRAPHLPLPWSSPHHAMPVPQLMERLRELGGTPPEVLEHPELMELILPVVRADFEVLETYSFAAGEPLEVPISAFGARDDPEVSPEAVEAWREHTRGAWHSRLFDGGHFFIQQERQAFLREVGRRLSLHL